MKVIDKQNQLIKAVNEQNVSIEAIDEQNHRWVQSTSIESSCFFLPRICAIEVL